VVGFCPLLPPFNPSVKVHDLHVVGVPLLPYETNSVLLRDANTVLARSVTLKLFEKVAGEDLQVLELDGRLQDHELPTSLSLQISRNDDTFGAFVYRLRLR
jgi:hypothetical protein